jgi:hypothetical protein
MYRRIFVEACLTVLLLVTVGTPAMASPSVLRGARRRGRPRLPG